MQKSGNSPIICPWSNGLLTFGEIIPVLPGWKLSPYHPADHYIRVLYRPWFFIDVSTHPAISEADLCPISRRRCTHAFVMRRHGPPRSAGGPIWVHVWPGIFRVLKLRDFASAVVYLPLCSCRARIKSSVSNSSTSVLSLGGTAHIFTEYGQYGVWHSNRSTKSVCNARWTTRGRMWVLTYTSLTWQDTFASFTVGFTTRSSFGQEIGALLERNLI